MPTIHEPEYETIYLNPDGQWVGGFKAWIGYGAIEFREYCWGLVPATLFDGD